MRKGVNILTYFKRLFWLFYDELPERRWGTMAKVEAKITFLS